jgi:hypothetical protein
MVIMGDADGTTERPQGFEKFEKALKRVLKVSKEELDRREAAYRKRSQANPNRRGPKKAKDVFVRPSV